MLLAIAVQRLSLSLSLPVSLSLGHSPNRSPHTNRAHAQVGGLGDVVTSLAKAHQASGTLCEIILPKYDVAAYRCIEGLRHLASFSVAWDGGAVQTHAWGGVVEGLPVYLIEPEHPAAFFWRGAFYGQVRVL